MELVRQSTGGRDGEGVTTCASVCPTATSAPLGDFWENPSPTEEDNEAERIGIMPIVTEQSQEHSQHSNVDLTPKSFFFADFTCYLLFSLNTTYALGPFTRKSPEYKPNSHRDCL